MSVLNPTSTLQLPLKRPIEDAHGNKTFADLGTIEAVVSLSAGSAGRSWSAHGARFVQAGTIFVRRGSDVLSGDEVLYNGHTFFITGDARGNQDHPFTGDDFGWVGYTLAGGG